MGRAPPAALCRLTRWANGMADRRGSDRAARGYSRRTGVWHRLRQHPPGRSATPAPTQRSLRAL
eukprot:11530292-Alexandrium_andersonii.AAC.1